MCYHCTLEWSKQALNTLLSGLGHTEGSRGCGYKEINWPDTKQRGGPERETGWVEGADPIRIDDDCLCSNWVFIWRATGNW